MESLKLKFINAVLLDKNGNIERYKLTNETYKLTMEKIGKDIKLIQQWKNTYNNGYEIVKEYHSKKFQKTILFWEVYGCVTETKRKLKNEN